MDLTIATVPLVIAGVLIKKIMAKMDPTADKDDEKSNEADRAKSRLNAKLRKNGRDAVLHTNKYEDQIMGDIFFPDQIEVTFGDIGGMAQLKERIYESAILPLLTPALFTSLRNDSSSASLLSLPKGILFYGPPGTGKTMMAKAIAKECDATFINVKLSTLQNKWFGESQKIVSAIFSLARKFAPSIIFIDEIDLFLRSRDDGSSHEAYSSIKAEFMSQWDGLTTNDSEQVTVLGATNRPFDIDVAILRRLPRTFLFDLPNLSERKAILEVILHNQKTAPDFDFTKVAGQTDCYSGSDLKELCKYACMIPVRDLIRKHRQADIAKYGPNARTTIPKDSKPEYLSNKHIEASLSHVQATGRASYQYQKRFEAEKAGGFQSMQNPSAGSPSASGPLGGSMDPSQIDAMLKSYLAALASMQNSNVNPANSQTGSNANQPRVD